MDQRICDAIENHQLLSFAYRGYQRVVEPHAYGTNRRGKEVLRGYQAEGGSVSGDAYGWKLFYVAEIDNLNVLDKRFGQARDEYEPVDREIHTVYCQL